MKGSVLIGLIPLVVLSVGTVRPGVEDTGGRASFVLSFVEALNSRNPDRQKALVHPKSLVCPNGRAVSFFDEMFSPRMKPPVPADYGSEFTPVPTNAPPLFADRFDYPVPPTHLLRLDFETAPKTSTTFVVQVVQVANRWYVVAACPKPETSTAAEAASQARVKRAERVRELAASITPQLKETVLRLVREGHKIDAIMEYQKASGEDLSIAKEVVELVTSQSG